MPARKARSDGLIGEAATLTRTCPGPGSRNREVLYKRDAFGIIIVETKARMVWGVSDMCVVSQFSRAVVTVPV